MTGAFVLRRPTELDLPELFAMHDAASSQQAGVPSKSWEDFESQWLNKLVDPAAHAQVAEAADGRLVGSIMTWMDEELCGCSRHVGYWVAQHARRQGIATQLLARFLILEPARPLVAIVAEHNPASQRVLERNGFVRKIDVTNPWFGHVEQVWVLACDPKV